MQSSYLVISVLSLMWLILCIAMWWIHQLRTKPKLQADATTLIAYASQTGNAQSIARQFAKALSVTEKVDAIALNSLTIEHLSQFEKVLFIVSTYGDGDAPDNGEQFIQRLTTELNNVATSKAETNDAETSKAINHLGYSVIALGDSDYPDFCAFGYQVHQTLQECGASPLSGVITIDNYDELTPELADITPSWLSLSISPSAVNSQAVKSSQYWQLIQRELLNPDCNDEPLLQLTFKSIGPNPTWHAGDLIAIQPKQPIDIVEKWLDKNKFNGDVWLTHQGCQQTLKAWLLERELPEVHSYSADELLQQLPYLAKRSYSIASIPEEGHLQLIVRLFEKPNSVTKKQVFGLASGFLSHYSQIADVIEGQIKDVHSNHNIDHTKPIILIGAGSGLAGLKAQIAQRFYLAEQQGKSVGKSWLIFGERNSNKHHPVNQQLTAFTQGEPAKVNKVSCAFSQDPQYPKYVQDVLIKEQDTLKSWLDDGAYIYVCGSLTGMGKSVQETLMSILGEVELQALQQQRYIRDVY